MKKIAEVLVYGLPLFAYPEDVQKKFSDNKYVIHYVNEKGEDQLLFGKVLKRIEDKTEFEKEEYGFIVSSLFKTRYSQVELRKIHKEVKDSILTQDEELWKLLGSIAENFQLIIYEDYQK